ncbi:hypothetical protein EVAR_79854_1 [Eumeta japonica]|uniref:Uncharacterized protein n=1 Tax=Eumeta variegata TaxID=151549 RepID=A0A4C1TZL5_EUMVA|nr:hypothetical protein EVAR_79854_1 [Eumeta japonica]
MDENKNKSSRREVDTFEREFTFFDSRKAPIVKKEKQAFSLRTASIGKRSVAFQFFALEMVRMFRPVGAP